MLIIRLLHIVAAFWSIAGLLGRWLAFAQARRSGDVHTACALLRLSERFERMMAIPGSQALLASGLLTGKTWNSTLRLEPYGADLLR